MQRECATGCEAFRLPDDYYSYVQPFPAETQGEWQHKTRVSAHVRNSMTHEEIFAYCGLVNMINRGYTLMAEEMAARFEWGTGLKIQVWLNHPAPSAAESWAIC